MPTPTPSPAVIAADIARRLLGPGALVSRFQAENSSVFRVDFAPGTQPHVIKIAARNPESIAREQHIVRHLAQHGFEVPIPEFTQADYPELNLDFTVMPLIRGTPSAAIYAQDSRRGAAVVERLGRFLGRVAKLAPASVPAAMPAAQAQARELAAWDAHNRSLHDSPRARPEFFLHYRQVRALIETPPTWFGNRAGCHMITDGSDTFTVIDWGDAGWIWPYADLARCIHNMRAVSDLRGGRWLECLLRGFGAERPLEDGWIETVETWLLYFCIRDAILFRNTQRELAGIRLLKLAQQTSNRRWMAGT